MLDSTCADLESTFPYMDDTRVGSLERETHLQHFDKLFSALAANGLAINLEKCVFEVPTLEFLGHRISAAGSAPETDHTVEIQNCPPPLPGHLTIATFSRHGKLLPLFLAKLCSSVAPLNQSPKRGTADSAVDRRSPGVFSKG
jgi:hypothetical protein